ncbi:MAG TPA: DUF4870 domain-containing protein [Patescibacteria group bacterium]|nr:DUF4870 domain-containing protein [Patescibacteria group bacterium]
MENSAIPPLTEKTFEAKDIEENKALAIIGYLGLLCLLPLLLKKDSPYAKYHGIQGLVLCIFWVIINAVGIIPVLGWMIAVLGNILCLLLMIVGMLHAANGEGKELPFIGQYAKNLNL